MKIADKIPALCLLALLLSSCTADSSTPAEVKSSSSVNTVAAKAPVQGQQLVANTSVFDVPVLLRKNIDQITAQLGKPKEEDSPNLTTDEFERRYSEGGYNLVITYNAKTKKAESIMVVADSGKAKDCAKLLSAGNLRLNDSRYSVDSLASQKEGYYESIVATSN